MTTHLKNSLSPEKTIFILSVLSVLSGIICCILADFFVPVLAGFLAVLYLYSDERTKIAPRLVSGIIVALNIASILVFRISASLFGISAVAIAFIIYLGFKKKSSKSDCCYLMTVVCAAILFVSFALYAMVETGEFSFEAVKTFYGDLITTFRIIFLDTAAKAYAEYITGEGSLITLEVLEYSFDIFVKSLISYFMIAGFIITGITAKIFTSLASRLAEDKTELKEWRFKPTPVFAYFYLIVTVSSLFLSMDSGILAVTVLNLSNIFMAIFAYVGFYYAVDFFSRRMKRGLAVFITIVAVLLLSRFSLNLLSMLGMYKVVLDSRRPFSTPPTAE